MTPAARAVICLAALAGSAMAGVDVGPTASTSHYDPAAGETPSPWCYQSLAASAGSSHFNPKSPARPLALATTKGLDWSLGCAASSHRPSSPVFFVVYDDTARMSNLLWDSSLAELVDLAPKAEVTLVFLSYSSDVAKAEEEVRALENRHRAELDKMDAATRTHWEKQLVYSTSAGAGAGTWLPELTKDWTVGLAHNHCSLDTDRRMEAATPVPAPDFCGTEGQIWSCMQQGRQCCDDGRCAAPGQACDSNASSVTPARLQAMWDNLRQANRRSQNDVPWPKFCGFESEIFACMQQQRKCCGSVCAAPGESCDESRVDSALSMLRGLSDVATPAPDFCGTEGQIWSCMQQGRQCCDDGRCAAPGKDCTESLALGAAKALRRPAVIGVDSECRIREVGSPLWIKGLADYIQQYSYEDSIAAQTSGLVTVPVFKQASDRLHSTLTSAPLNLPPADKMRTFTRLFVEMDLGCDDHRQANCGPWDYILDGTITCGNASHRIARWITPYMREGHWLTDITPALPLLAASASDCPDGARFTLKTDHRQQYDITLAFHFGSDATEPVPAAATPLWTSNSTGEPLDGHYSARMKPRSVTLHDGQKGAVAAMLTGHGFGYDDRNCAEFCPLRHRISSGEGHTADFQWPEAGVRGGCSDKVTQGVVPDQAGTWPTGRNGWCPGWDVKWTLEDIPAPSGDLTLQYQAELDGSEYTIDPSHPGTPVVQLDIYWVAYASSKDIL